MNEEEKPASWTLAAIKSRGLALKGYCETDGCGHFYAFSVDGLIESAGSDYVVPDVSTGDCLRRLRRAAEVEASDGAAGGVRGTH